MSEEPEYVRAARARALTGAQRDPNADTLRRELIRVESIPTPPDAPVHLPDIVAQDRPPSGALAAERDVVTTISDLSERLQGYGLRFGPGQKQDLIDYAFALINGFAGGGAMRGR